MSLSPISSKKYILVADDSADDFMLVRIAFARAGLPHQLIYLRRADHVISYLKGLEPFGDRTLYPFPDLLLLDHSMPGVGGFHILTHLRDHPEIKAPPAVTLSGASADQETSTALRLGAAACFTKPSDFDEFVKLARTIHDQFLADSASK